MALITGDTIDSADGDDPLPGGGGGDSLEGSAENDRLIGGNVSRQIDDQPALAASRANNVRRRAAPAMERPLYPKRAASTRPPA